MATQSEPRKKTALIIGAGPAGLTAAYELLTRTDIMPIIFEASNDIGGISKTVEFKGNRIDIGGHRFFSKSDRVMNWWAQILPVEQTDGLNSTITYHHESRAIPEGMKTADPTKTDNVMLLRKRLSRIYFLKKFFDYPISLSPQTIKQLGLVRITKIGLSYLNARAFPIQREKTLQDFMVNRFGWELYRTFFKDYTEKVWGVPCDQIAADWGAQRIKGLSITAAVMHAVKQPFQRSHGLAQKDTETSLIEQFMYPKLGPGQLWQEVARMVQEKGGVIHMRHYATKLHLVGNRIASIDVKDGDSGNTTNHTADYVFSTMPVKELINDITPQPSANVIEVAQGLLYRDFMTVGLLVKKLSLKDESGQLAKVDDNWIYIQERDVKLGRLQIFNNWSPYLVKDANTIWMGLEYFCNEGDELWSMTDEDFKAFAIKELDHIGIIESKDVLDGVVIRMPKTYPAYFGTYDRFNEIRDYTNAIPNLFLVGRNGMHKYNNADHSMLTAMTAVDNIIEGQTDKDNLWAVNTESSYHERK